MKNKDLNKYETSALKELQTIRFQNLPLIKLVEKNYVERGLTNEQIAEVLYRLYCDGKIEISENTMSPLTPYDKLIVAHYESLHRANTII